MAVLSVLVAGRDENYYLAPGGEGRTLAEARRFGSPRAARAFADEKAPMLPEGIDLVVCDDDGWPILRPILVTPYSLTSVLRDLDPRPPHCRLSRVHGHAFRVATADEGANDPCLPEGFWQGEEYDPFSGDQEAA